MKYEKCSQFKCTFNSESETVPKEQRGALSLMCPTCEKCGAPPQYVSKDGCSECLKCESCAGELRSGSPKPLMEIAILKTNEIEEVIEIGFRKQSPKTPR